jgi:UDP-3-O-[3-hydroxymyristoyl] glucosamine N-acyltransferase LpxD
MKEPTDIKPTDIRYDHQGIYIKEQFIQSDNPRLAFAKQLAEIPDEGRWYVREGSMFHSRVACDFRYIKWGVHCVIGGAGFGYEKEEDETLFPIPHHGWVYIENGVTIHNNVAIDRGVVGATIIGEGTKIDNLVHIAHSVKIGRNCLIVAGAVLGGSCEIGDGSFIGINASIKNKVKIGKGVTVGMGAVITKDVPDGATVVGLNKIL